MDPKELARLIADARAAKKSDSEIDAVIRQVYRISLADAESLIAGGTVLPVAPAQPAPVSPSPIQTRHPLSNVPVAGNPYIGPGIQLTPRDVGNQAALLGQGAAWGWGDELVGAARGAVPGGMGYREGRDAARARLLQARQEQPGAAALEGMGALLSPLNAVGLALKPATVTGRVLGGVGAGAGIGATAAAGAAPEMKDIPLLAAQGAGIGGLLGGGAGALAAIPTVWSNLFGRAASSRGARISSELESLGGSRGSMPQVRAEQEAFRRSISQRYFKPLDDLGPLENNEAILGLLDNPTVSGLMPKAVREGARGPTFDELLRVRDLLQESTGRLYRGKIPPKELVLHREALAATEDALGTLPEYAAGRPLYAEAKAVQDALLKGRQMYSKAGWEIREAIAGLTSDAQKEAFRRGLMSRLSESLGRKSGGHTDVMQNLFHRGPETTEKLQAMFPSDQAYGQFVRLLDTEAKTGDVARFIKTAAPWAVVGGLGGGAFGVSLLRGLLP